MFSRVLIYISNLFVFFRSVINFAETCTYVIVFNSHETADSKIG